MIAVANKHETPFAAVSDELAAAFINAMLQASSIALHGPDPRGTELMEKCQTVLGQALEDYAAMLAVGTAQIKVQDDNEPKSYKVIYGETKADPDTGSQISWDNRVVYIQGRNEDEVRELFPQRLPSSMTTKFEIKSVERVE